MSHYWGTWTFNGFEFVLADGHVAIHPDTAQFSNPAWIQALHHAMESVTLIDANQNLGDFVVSYPALEYPQGLEWLGKYFKVFEDAKCELPDDLHDLHDKYVRAMAGEEIRQRKQEQRRTKLEQPNPGFVYLVKAPDGNYKIGRAKNVHDRMKTFTIKLPMPVELAHVIKCEQYCLAERSLHERYAQRRVAGEWFALTPEEVAEIQAIKEM